MQFSGKYTQAHVKPKVNSEGVPPIMYKSACSQSLTMKYNGGLYHCSQN